MADYHALTALAWTLLHPVMADELPNEMLFQCEGKMNAVLDAAKPETRNSTFRINLRLRDRVIVDMQTGLVEGAECMQESGEIKCKVTKLYPLANSVVKRFSTVVINRKTRELTLWLEFVGLPRKRCVRDADSSLARIENRYLPRRRSILVLGPLRRGYSLQMRGYGFVADCACACLRFCAN